MAGQQQRGMGVICRTVCSASQGGYGATLYKEEKGYTSCTRIQVCGCHEIWCPIKNWVLTDPKDQRQQCFTVSKIFGCFRNGKYTEDCAAKQRFETTVRHGGQKHYQTVWSKSEVPFW